MLRQQQQQQRQQEEQQLAMTSSMSMMYPSSSSSTSSVSTSFSSTRLYAAISPRCNVCSSLSTSSPSPIRSNLNHHLRGGRVSRMMSYSSSHRSCLSPTSTTSMSMSRSLSTSRSMPIAVSRSMELSSGSRTMCVSTHRYRQLQTPIKKSMCLWMTMNSMEDPFTSTPISTTTSTTTSSTKPTTTGTTSSSSSSSNPRTASDFYEMGVQEARRMTTTPTSTPTSTTTSIATSIANRNDDNDDGQSYREKKPMQDMQLVIQQALATLQTGIIVSSFPHS